MHQGKDGLLGPKCIRGRVTSASSLGWACPLLHMRGWMQPRFPLRILSMSSKKALPSLYAAGAK